MSPVDPPQACTAAEAQRDFESAFQALRGALDGPQPEGTSRQILEAAETLIAEGGMSGFSMRSIGNRVGISLASVQYHYPTRADLLRRLFDFRAQVCADVLKQKLLVLSGDPAAALRFAVLSLLNDALDPRTGALYTQLWALASYDPDARVALEKHMRVYVRLLTLLVSRLRPALSARTATHRATAIVAMVEGFPTAAAGAARSPDDVQHVKDALLEVAMAISAADPPERASMAAALIDDEATVTRQIDAQRRTA